ncbi:MAG: AmmeMemoRadiSam system protein B [Deltaproteobacteria bacterium]|jgi:AmmeMemoRadiSam system protein B|nr:AmmeMemoRadiSam system protein B [Deltaproteobacteria bacterium]
MIRPPAVAGQFYPGNKSALSEMLQLLIPASEIHQRLIGLMSPHAGYIYSGSVAGRTFSNVFIPEEVIILGPNHHGQGHQAAVYDHGSWQTPLGEIAIAEKLAKAVLDSCDYLSEDTLAHRFEHSLEVQVPFLQILSSTVRILPICIGRLPLEALLSIGDCLAEVIADRPCKPLIVASTDMTHYEPGDIAHQKDFAALEYVKKINPVGLHKTVTEKHISMCGVMPVVVMLQAALKLGATMAELVDYKNSGEVTGDQSEVVGYAGVRVY